MAYDHLRSYENEQSLLSKTLEFLVRNGTKLEHVNLRITNRLHMNSDWNNTTLAAFQSRMTADSVKSHLTSLAVSYCNMSQSTGEPSLFVISLNKLLDTSCLHDLKLSGFQAEDLQWAADNCYFTALKKLELHFIAIPGYLEEGDVPRHAIKAFLSSLQPLSTLRLLRIGHSFELLQVLGHHRLSLTNLAIFYQKHRFPDAGKYCTTDVSNMLHISKHCPIVASLEVEVKRCFSSDSERNIYKAFSNLPALQYLKLHIDCTPDSRSDLGDSPNLRNSAFDEGLAKSIWNLISRTKVGLALVQLELYPECQSLLSESRSGEIRLTRLRPPALMGLDSICRSYILIKTMECHGESGVSLRRVPTLENVLRDTHTTDDGPFEHGSLKSDDDQSVHSWKQSGIQKWVNLVGRRHVLAYHF